MLRSIVLVVVMASLTAGCAVGRKQEFQSAPLDVNATSKSINVGVLDHRSYVLDKSKPETFTGLSRSGLGIPFDINTASGGPLADDMAKALASSLSAKGATATVVKLPPSIGDKEAMAKVARPAGKGLLVVLQEWRSDTYVNTQLFFDIRAFVVDSTGQPVGENRISGADDLPYEGLDSRVTAPINAFRRKMPQLLVAPAIANQL